MHDACCTRENPTDGAGQMTARRPLVPSLLSDSRPVVCASPRRSDVSDPLPRRSAGLGVWLRVEYAYRWLRDPSLPLCCGCEFSVGFCFASLRSVRDSFPLPLPSRMNLCCCLLRTFRRRDRSRVRVRLSEGVWGGTPWLPRLSYFVFRPWTSWDVFQAVSGAPVVQTEFPGGPRYSRSCSSSGSGVYRGCPVVDMANCTSAFRVQRLAGRQTGGEAGSVSADAGDLW
ncbi:hypothetical protein CDEST_02499 [Colletotrichum destructivum]|uniref:Uncharacterized protein n=1 Tax=Colletotrichum destructivum TaxID=34406 RepID=A0AAX4I296_9PEZI|nr:hypothetical protein CDEST_02499 [Colletotrichum destructivum]